MGGDIGRGYRELMYPITHRNELPTLPTEKDMNEVLDRLSRSAAGLLQRMRTMAIEAERRAW